MNRSYNPSSLALARQCEICYKLRYIDGIETPSNLDLQFGTALHFGLQTMLSGEPGYAQDFEGYWNHQKHLDGSARYSWEDLLRQGLTLLERFERMYLKKFKLFKQEERLESELNGIRCHGTPDFIGDFDGIPSIVDFKTASYSYHKECAQTSEQMIFYAWLAEKTLGFSAQQVVYIPFIKGDTPRIQKPVIYKLTKEMTDKCMYNYYLQCAYLESKNKGLRDYYMNYSHAIQGDRKNPCFDYWFGSKSL